MEKISVEQVKHVAELSRLAITDEEAQQLTKDLQNILTRTEELNEVDTTDVKPTIQLLNMVNVMRDDEPKEWTTHEEVVQNAPDQANGQFRVPSILSE